MRRGARAAALALAFAVLATAACGSRRSTDDLAEAAGARIVDAGGRSISADGALQNDPVTAPTGEAAGDTGGTGAAGGPSGTASGRAPGSVGASGSGLGGSSQGRVTAGASGAPIKIGVVGTMSGVGGTQLASTRAVQAWAQARNRAGGLRGHPVEVLVVDDGGDPARFRAGLQDLVERRGAIAFVAGLTGFSISEGAVKYLEDKRVPMVGGDRLSALWNQSPMMFPQASSGDAVIWNHSVNTQRVAGRGASVGWVACQEAQICKDADRLWQQYLPQLGMNVRYRATVSVAQPGFTAECAAAQQNGVEVFLLGTDANSTRRIANDCAKQRYNPKFGVLQTSDEMAREPALDGGFFGSATFPWVSNETPAAREFRETMEKFAPNVELSAHASSGWVAAKMFEAASTRIGDRPTSGEVLEGLWALDGETLGGLAAPIRFQRNKPASPSYCFFPMVIAGKSWTASPREMLCRAPG